MNKKYLGDTLVDIQRHFTLGGITYAVIKDKNGENKSVATFYLTDKPTKLKNVPTEENLEDPKQSIEAYKNDRLVGTFDSFDSSTFKKFMKKNKLNPNAVQFILNGVQKYHKSFTFNYSKLN